MSDTQTICITSVIVVLCLLRAVELLINPIKQAIKEFDLDELHVQGRTINIKGKP